MKLINRIKNYIERAYMSGHFPSFWNLYFSKKKVYAYYGFLGDKNFGDELVFIGTKHLFKEQLLLPILHHSPLYVKLFKLIFYKKIAGIVIGGGTLIGPYFVEEVFFSKISTRNLPVFFHGTGVTPTINFHSLWNNLLDQRERWYGGFRGTISTERIDKALGVKRKVIGDACFSLYEAPVYKPFREKAILVNYGAHNKYDGQDYCKLQLAKFLIWAVSDGYNVHFLPMHAIDIEEAKFFKKEIPSLKVLSIPVHFSEAKEIFANYQFAVGVRLHFIALAILCHVPFYSINYKDKHDDLLQSLDLSFAGRRSTETSEETIVEIFQEKQAFNWETIDKKLKDLKRKQQIAYNLISKSTEELN